jgi:hypothetical protein
MSTPVNKKANGRQPVGSAKTAINGTKCTGKATTTPAQERRILTALRQGPKTTDDLRSKGCYQVSARIFGLRAKGYNIVTELFNGYAADGFSHARMARYRLIDEGALK